MQNDATLRAESYGEDLPDHDEVRDCGNVKPAPTPWQVHDGYVYGPECPMTTVNDEDGKPVPHRTGLIALVYGCSTPNKSPEIGQNAANAALIVRAVNSHAALVDALEMFECATDSGDPDDYIVAEREMKKALKLARGEA